jgi:SAM-dependent methyltransferase
MTSAGDFDYDRHGSGYATVRQADPRIAAQLHAHLGNARRVLNVGAGAGSYEPLDRQLFAVEPSAAMRAQRPRHHPPAIIGRAEALPFDDGVFDAAMASITVHQWQDLPRGLAELRRVTRGPIVILAFDPDRTERFWLARYSPELVAVVRRRDPSLDRLRDALGPIEVHEVTIPLDCTDGFTEAFYGRPERLLEPAVRAAQSSWGFIEPPDVERSVAMLAADLSSGAWDEQHGALRTQPTFVGSLVLVVAHG